MTPTDIDPNDILNQTAVQSVIKELTAPGGLDGYADPDTANATDADVTAARLGKQFSDAADTSDQQVLPDLYANSYGTAFKAHTDAVDSVHQTLDGIANAAMDHFHRLTDSIDQQFGQGTQSPTTADTVQTDTGQPAQADTGEQAPAQTDNAVEAAQPTPAPTSQPTDQGMQATPPDESRPGFNPPTPAPQAAAPQVTPAPAAPPAQPAPQPDETSRLQPSGDYLSDPNFKSDLTRYSDAVERLLPGAGTFAGAQARLETGNGQQFSTAFNFGNVGNTDTNAKGGGGFPNPEAAAQAWVNFVTNNGGQTRYQSFIDHASKGADVSVLANDMHNAGYATDPDYASKITGVAAAAPQSHADPAVATSTNAALQAGAPPAAVQWAEQHLGSNQFTELCEKFVELAETGHAGIAPSAIAAWNAAQKDGIAQTDLAGIKSGDEVSFGADASNNYFGHTGVYQGNGQFISATDNGVRQYSIGDWEKLTGQKLLGYIPQAGSTAVSPPPTGGGDNRSPFQKAAGVIQKAAGAIGTAAQDAYGFLQPGEQAIKDQFGNLRNGAGQVVKDALNDFTSAPADIFTSLANQSVGNAAQERSKNTLAAVGDAASAIGSKVPQPVKNAYNTVQGALSAEVPGTSADAGTITIPGTQTQIPVDQTIQDLITRIPGIGSKLAELNAKTEGNPLSPGLDKPGNMSVGDVINVAAAAAPELGGPVLDGIKAAYAGRAASALESTPDVADAAVVAAKAPEVIVRPEDIHQESEAFGGQYNVHTATGSTINGTPITADQLPETVYHVTVNAPGVDASKMLLAQPKDVGLGSGGSIIHQGVSFTADPAIAAQIETDLKRAPELINAKTDDVPALLNRFAREDEQTSGLHQGALQKAVDSSIDVLDKKAGLAANSQDVNYSVLNQYNLARDRAGGPENPILLGGYRNYAKLNPEDIKTLAVDSSDLPKEPLIVKSPVGTHLDELRVYGDVPTDTAKYVSATPKNFDINEGLNTAQQMLGVPVGEAVGPGRVMGGGGVDFTQEADIRQQARGAFNDAIRTGKTRAEAEQIYSDTTDQLRTEAAAQERRQAEEAQFRPSEQAPVAAGGGTVGPPRGPSTSLETPGPGGTGKNLNNSALDDIFEMHDRTGKPTGSWTDIFKNSKDWLASNFADRFAPINEASGRAKAQIDADVKAGKLTAAAGAARKQAVDAEAFASTFAGRGQAALFRVQKDLKPAVDVVGTKQWTSDGRTGLDYLNAYVKAQTDLERSRIKGVASNPKTGEAVYVTRGNLEGVPQNLRKASAGVNDEITAMSTLDDIRQRVGQENWEKLVKADGIRQQAMDKLLSDKVDAGLITRSLADHLKEMYPHYNPVKLTDYLESEASGTGGRLSQSTNLLKKLTEAGSEADTEKSMTSATRALIQGDIAVRRNGVANSIIEALKVDPQMKGKIGMVSTTADKSYVPKLGTPEASVKLPQPAGNTISRWVNGEKETWQVPKGIADVANNLDGPQSNALSKLLENMNKPVRAGATTLNLGFTIATRPIRNLVYGLANEGLAPWDQLQGMVQVMRKSPVWQDYVEHGGGMGGAQVGLSEKSALSKLSDLQHNQEQLENLITSNGGTVLNPHNWLRGLQQTLDAGPRVAAYQKHLAAGDSPVQAAMFGRRAVTDFARGGTAAKEISAMSLFFNDRVRAGLDIARALRDKPSAKYVVGGIFGTAAGLYEYNTSHSEYYDIPQYIRDGSLVIMKPWSTPSAPDYFALPLRDFAPAVLLANTLMSRAVDQKHADTRNAGELGLTAAGQLSPVQADYSKGMNAVLGFASSFAPGIPRVVLEEIANRDLYRNRPIIGQGESNLSPGMQVGSTGASSAFAKDISQSGLGQKLQLSPERVDYALRNTGIVQGAPGEALSGAYDILRGRQQQSAPVIGGITGTVNRQTGGQTVQDFYDAVDKATSDASAAAMQSIEQQAKSPEYQAATDEQRREHALRVKDIFKQQIMQQRFGSTDPTLVLDNYRKQLATKGLTPQMTNTYLAHAAQQLMPQQRLAQYQASLDKANLTPAQKAAHMAEAKKQLAA